MILAGELDALPSLEGMAKGIKDVEGIMNNILKVCVFNNFLL